MSHFRYILGGLLGVILGTLVLQELSVFPGLMRGGEMPSHNETILHGVIIMFAFILAGMGAAAWMNLFEVGGQYRRRVADLTEINSLKNDLLSTASHEIRSPITSILWGLREIIESKDPPVDESHRKMLKQIHDAVFLLRATANDFLNLARLENNTLEIMLKPVSLDEFGTAISSTIEESRTRAEMLGINLTSDVHIAGGNFIAADMRRISEVLANLIENAVNYSVRGGAVETSARVDGGNLVITVQDHGIGIPEADKPNIFKKMFRAVNARRAQSTGTGLGLYLSKKFVEAHDGSIWFESKEGEGTRFAFTLPIHRGAPVEEFFKRI